MKSSLLAALLPTFVAAIPSAHQPIYSVVPEPSGLDDAVGNGTLAGLKIKTFSGPDCKKQDLSLHSHDIIIGETLSYTTWSYHLSDPLGDDMYLRKYQDPQCRDEFHPGETQGSCHTFNQELGEVQCLKVVM